MKRTVPESFRVLLLLCYYFVGAAPEKRLEIVWGVWRSAMDLVTSRQQLIWQSEARTSAGLIGAIPGMNRGSILRSYTYFW